MSLTAVQEDYIELVYRKSHDQLEGIRVTDLASWLGCRLPTVTRTVQVLTREGYFIHERRGLVKLTTLGKKVGKQMVHRHSDLAEFLMNVLHLSPEIAEQDACQIEHGLSPEAAERLHLFLNHYASLSSDIREGIKKAVTVKTSQSFDYLIKNRGSGWRI